MKPIKFTLITVATLLLLSSCKNPKKAEIKIVESAVVESTHQAEIQVDMANFTTASFTINGMSCKMGCAKPIEKKLAKLEGIGSAKVDFENKLATVKFDAEKLSQEDFEQTVKAVSEKYSVEGYMEDKSEL